MNIGIIGCGNIGSALYLLISKEKKRIKDQYNLEIDNIKVCDRNPQTKSKLNIPDEDFTSDYKKLILDKNIGLIIELTGTIDPAKEIVIEAFNNGKHVVTANKAMLAEYAEEIMEASSKSGKQFRFEASVGGCIPVIRTIQQSYASDHIESVYGILNGTTNYILTRMEGGMSYDQALKQAQQKGFAEPDPSSDVEGKDAAQKVIVLATIINQSFFNNKIFTEGIDKISLLDIEFAREMGYRIKLLGMVKNLSGSCSMKVHPVMIPAVHPLAKVDSEFNAIFLKSTYTKDSMLYGKGAGPNPTATVIFGDIIDILRGTEVNNHYSRNVKSIDIDDTSMRYYLRFTVVDKPGVLGKITTIMGKHNISISGAVQKEEKKKNVPVIITTYEASERSLKKAVNEIDNLDIIQEKTRMIRIEDI